MGKSCCFAGHSDIFKTNELYKELTALIEKLITEEDVTKFRVGHYGSFDSLSAKAVREVKEKYPHIHLELLIPYLTTGIVDYNEYYKKKYDGVLLAVIPDNTPRRVYIKKCNENMVDLSEFLICYVNRSFGGARYTLDYAKRRKHIKVYNLAEK